MSYSPEFTGPIEGYVVNFMKKHYWKVERTQTRDDVLQEARLVFLRCREKYQDLDTPQHFMALFKRAWANEFIDLANADTASRVLVQPPVDRETGEQITDLYGESDNDGSLSVMLRQAPAEVTMVLNLFLSAPQEILDLALGSWKGRDKRCRTGGSKRICKMLGLPQELDVLKLVEDYFHS